MEKAKRRIRVVLLCVVLAAVFVGILYYYYNIKGGSDMTEGTLIADISGIGERMMRYVRR